MRRIQNQALETMASPVRGVMAHLHRAMVNIAPEKKAAFDREFNDFTLEYVDSHRWLCHVDLTQKRIRISGKTVEVLWAASLMYFTLYQVAQQRPGGTVIDIPNDPKLAPAADLYAWAILSLTDENAGPWPDNLPKPLPAPLPESDEAVADELCLCALALLMHHELGHMALRHDGQADPEVERDADYHAVDWILGGLDQTHPFFIKRALGATVAFGVTAAREIHAGRFGGNTHPRGFDRLFHSLSRHVLDPNHVVWFAVGLIFALHVAHLGVEVPSPEEGFPSARACADAYVEFLSHFAEPSR